VINSLFKNLNFYRNSILFFVGIQIPDNYENIKNFQYEFTKLELPNRKFFFQITKPNFSEIKFKFIKLDLVLGVNSFVLGYISKIIDIYISYSLNYHVQNKYQTHKFYELIFDDLYCVPGNEILDFLILNNKSLVENKNANKSLLNFGIGSFAALYDYSTFLKNNNKFNTFLGCYLNNENKKLLIRNIEKILIDNIYKKKLLLSDLFINNINHNILSK